MNRGFSASEQWIVANQQRRDSFARTNAEMSKYVQELTERWWRNSIYYNNILHGLPLKRKYNKVYKQEFIENATGDRYMVQNTRRCIPKHRYCMMIKMPYGWKHVRSISYYKLRKEFTPA